MANGQHNCLRALKINARRARNSDIVISPINGIRQSWPLKRNCDGPQKYDMKDPNDPWQVLLILTPAKEKMFNMAIESLPFSQENSTKKKEKKT